MLGSPRAPGLKRDEGTPRLALHVATVANVAGVPSLSRGAIPAGSRSSRRVHCVTAPNRPSRDRRAWPMAPRSRHASADSRQRPISSFFAKKPTAGDSWQPPAAASSPPGADGTTVHVSPKAHALETAKCGESALPAAMSPDDTGAPRGGDAACEEDGAVRAPDTHGADNDRSTSLERASPLGASERDGSTRDDGPACHDVGDGDAGTPASRALSPGDSELRSSEIEANECGTPDQHGGARAGVLHASEEGGGSGVDERGGACDGTGSEEEAPAHPKTGGATGADLEREREERIRRNRLILAEMLGEDLAAAEREQQRERAAKIRGRKAGKRRPTGEPAGPVRRSTRARGNKAGVDGDSVATAAVLDHEPQPEVDEEPTTFDDSGVLRYCCEGADGGGAADGVGVVTFPGCRGWEGGAERHSSEASPNGGSPGALRYRETGAVLMDECLTRAYSLDCRHGLVAAGGHQGRFAVWGVGGGVSSHAPVAPLMSARLFRGWISDVRFLSSRVAQSSGGDSAAGLSDDEDRAGILMLAASNDGAVALFDLGRESKGVPRRVAEEGGLHAGGIFSMDEQGGSVVTGSKDGSVKLSRVQPHGTLASVRAWDDAHGGAVVKCVRFRPNPGDCGAASVAASAGNDGCVRLWDARAPGKEAQAALRATDAAANVVEWHSRNEHLVMAAGFDAGVPLWDLRRPDQPTAVLRGHCGPGRVGKIYRPVFVDGGSHVAVSGPGSDALSVYSTESGAAVSRGHLGFCPTGLLAFADAGAPLLLATTKRVAAYVPADD